MLGRQLAVRRVTRVADRDRRSHASHTLRARDCGRRRAICARRGRWRRQTQRGARHLNDWIVAAESL